MRYAACLYAAIPKPLSEDPAWLRYERELRYFELTEMLARFALGVLEVQRQMAEVLLPVLHRITAAFAKIGENE